MITPLQYFSQTIKRARTYPKEVWLCVTFVSTRKLTVVFLHSSSEPQAVGDESVEQPTNSNITEGTTPAGKNPTENSPINPKETDNGNDTTSKTVKPPEVTISAADLQLSMARPPGTAQPAVKTS